ncbi:MAG: hypothetical protein A2Y23_02585 [Clostridiales bacterium GWB2_37_7]|nr:MAG: hypothetical protein A2Y23_02585 [Clostridiales bacterium GWB2_37_7]
MYSNRYSHINKYFAFAVMLFAVLSGVSDDYSEANAANTKDGNLAYFLKINHLFIQNSGKITTQVLINKYNAFCEYVQGIIAKDAAGIIFTSIAAGTLFFAAFFLNNKIMQNNLWRKAVF